MTDNPNNPNITINDRYRIESEIGSGGMAEVFKAYDLIEKRYVAIKVVKKEYCVNPQYMRRFEREARTVLNLKHKNIVEAYEYGTYMDRGFIVLEYVEGCTLKEYILKNGALDPKSAVKLIIRVLDALEYAHNQGYIHRDVKPQNVLLTTDKTVKLTDFGIAKETNAQTRTYDGNNVIGSVHYISPEQAKGENVGKESDLYSVGIMLYELLVGKPPFEGENSVQIALKQIKENIKLPEEVSSRIPPALNDVLMKATAKSRENRYHSAADMKNDLIRSMSHPRKHFVMLDYDDEPEESSEEQENKPHRKSKLWHVVLPVTLMLILVGVIFIVWYVNMISGTSKIPRVPELLGKDLELAEQYAHNRDYFIVVKGEMFSEEYPAGTVCKQIPESGTAKETGSTIEVYLSTGSEMITMIDLTGKTLEEAALLLSKTDISIDSVAYSQCDAEPGTIIWQSVPANGDVLRGDSIDVQVCGNADTPFAMPNLMVKNVFYAVNLLKTYGINDYSIRIADESELEADKTYVNGTVIFQTPSVGIPVVPSSVYAELVMYIDKETAATADFTSEIMVPADNSTVAVAMFTELGKIVIYEGVMDEGMQNLQFTAYYLKNGQYACVVYINDEEAFRVDKNFFGVSAENDQPSQDDVSDDTQK